MNKEKKFDAVKMMRDIRDRMNSDYLKNPVAFKKRLDAINEKFGIKKNSKILNRTHKLQNKN